MLDLLLGLLRRVLVLLILQVNRIQIERARVVITFVYARMMVSGEFVLVIMVRLLIIE